MRTKINYFMSAVLALMLSLGVNFAFAEKWYGKPEPLVVQPIPSIFEGKTPITLEELQNNLNELLGESAYSFEVGMDWDSYGIQENKDDDVQSLTRFSSLRNALFLDTLQKQLTIVSSISPDILAKVSKIEIQDKERGWLYRAGGKVEFNEQTGLLTINFDPDLRGDFPQAEGIDSAYTYNEVESYHITNKINPHNEGSQSREDKW